MCLDREIINYIIPLLREFREFKDIHYAEQPEFETLHKNTEAILDECFLDTATEYGISKWEKILGLSPKATETLEERRFKVKAELLANLPYTQRRLLEILTELCGQGMFTMNLDCVGLTLRVELAFESKSNVNAVCEMLRKILPVNLFLDVMSMTSGNAMISGAYLLGNRITIYPKQ